MNHHDAAFLLESVFDVCQKFDDSRHVVSDEFHLAMRLVSVVGGNELWIVSNHLSILRFDWPKDRMGRE